LSLELYLRAVVPAFLALAVAFGMDRMCEARGLLPPGFREPWRRTLAAAIVALILWVGAFSSLGSVGQGVEPDLTRLTTPQLFLLHGLLVLTIAFWFLLGFAGVRRGRGEIVPVEEIPEEIPPPAPPPPSLLQQFLVQFGFVAPNVPKEIGIGLLLGIGAWGAVLIVALAAGLALYSIGGEDALPKQPPALIPWIAALPAGVRLLISLSAGVVEETFFRGFLQPRVGILFSTLLFVAAHFSYGQPFMLVGIATLSLIYALLVRWRQNIWPAMAAHALFDAVQLLVVIPAALEMLDGKGGRAASILGCLSIGF
jgi:membrane protease YdiL (CAAX protease family)